MSTLRYWLRRCRDLVCPKHHEHKPEHVEQAPEGTRVAWVTLGEYAALLADYRLYRVVDPLTQTDKEAPQTDKQDMSIGEAVELEAEGSDHTRCAQCGERVIPLFYFEPGYRFSHFIVPAKNSKPTPGAGGRQP